MKVNIALVGGQAAPVFHVIDHYRPDKVVFVITDDKSVQRAHKAIVAECHKIGLNNTVTEYVDPVDPVQLTEKANELLETYKNDEVTLNVSGGTKAMSHIFGYKFQGAHNAAVVFIDQNNVIINFKDNSREFYDGFDLSRNFRMNGNALTQYARYSKYTPADLKVVDDLLRLWQKSKHLMKPIAVMNDSLKEAIENKLQTYSFEETVKKDKNSSIKISVSWQTNDGGTENTRVTLKTPGASYDFISPNALDLVFNSGWFECYVARILSKWGKTKGEVLMNCRFPAKEKDFKNRQIDQNEVDVIVNAGTKPLLVECKTNIHKPTDIDKFAKVIRNYGGLGSKGIFISLAPISPDRVEKCQKNSLAYFSFTQKADNIEERLYELLDNELIKLNSKA